MLGNGVSSVFGSGFASLSLPTPVPSQNRESTQAVRAVNQAGLFGADEELASAVGRACRGRFQYRTRCFLPARTEVDTAPHFTHTVGTGRRPRVRAIGFPARKLTARKTDRACG
jgi:hypothetical protein